jgi:GNAT superfamily N-acetyltransferase
MTRRGEFSDAGDARHSAAGIDGSLGPARSATPVDRAARSRNVSGAISVRRATLGDLPTIVELRLALLRENGDHPVYGQLRADAPERAYDVFGAQLRSPQEIMFLAEARTGIVGILRCVETLNSPLLHPDRYCYVSSVYVRPGSRRAGVLKALLRRADEWCSERGLTEMRLHNVPGGTASAAWSAEGFAVIEEVRRKGLERNR